MAVIREQDLSKGRDAWQAWQEAALDRGATASVKARSTTVQIDKTSATQASDGSDESDINADNSDGNTANTPMRLPQSHRLSVAPALPRPVMAMAVRYTLHLLERKAPGPGVEVRVAPWGAVKILDGPASDPHNLTPPDVIELDPDVWLRLAAGITEWSEEKDAGHISAVGERDDLSDLLPL